MLPFSLRRRFILIRVKELLVVFGGNLRAQQSEHHDVFGGVVMLGKEGRNEGRKGRIKGKLIIFTSLEGYLALRRGRCCHCFSHHAIIFITDTLHPINKLVSASSGRMRRCQAHSEPLIISSSSLRGVIVLLHQGSPL